MKKNSGLIQVAALLALFSYGPQGSQGNTVKNKVLFEATWESLQNYAYALKNPLKGNWMR